MSYPLKFPKQDPVVTITHPSSDTWILELHNGADNRLNGRVLREGFIPALNAVEREWRLEAAAARKAKLEKAGHGSLVIVGNRSQDKFFSNGLQYDEVEKNYNLFIHGFVNPVLSRLLSFPIPVVCAMNGHTFAGAFIIAMACDYRVMTSGKAWACMNEILFGAPVPQGCNGVIKAKAPTPAVLRKILLEGHRFVPKELLGVLLTREVDRCKTQHRRSGEAVSRRPFPGLHSEIEVRIGARGSAKSSSKKPISVEGKSASRTKPEIQNDMTRSGWLLFSCPRAHLTARGDTDITAKVHAALSAGAMAII